MTTPPTAARKILINNLIVALLAAGVWSQLDILYLLAASDNQAARLNWINPAILTISPVNSPAFSADRGYTGDGASSYLNTTYNLTTGGQLAAQDNNCGGIWSLTNNAGAGVADFGGTDLSLNTRDASNNFATRDASTTADSSGAVTTANGHLLITRSAAASYDKYKNAALLTNQVRTSGAFSSQALFGLARNNGSGSGTAFSTRQLAAMHVGAALTPTRITALYNALNSYLSAVGAV